MEVQEKKNKPALRFPDFVNDGEWEEDSVENLFTFIPNNTLSRAELNYEKGRFLNVHYGDVLIKFRECLDVSYEILPHITDDSVAYKFQNYRLKDGDVIIADTAEDETVGKCTEIINLVNEFVVSGLHTIALRPKRKFGSRYLGFYMNSDSYRNQLHKLMQGVKVTSISKSALKATIIKFPSSIEEQNKIASLLSAIDKMIVTTNVKLEQLNAYKKGMMQKLFPTQGKKLPEQRFKEFERNGEWEEKRLGDITNVINRRNKSNRSLPIYSVNNKDGFVPQSEQFEGLDSENRGYDISMYKIVGRNTFAYNPARINVGSIGYSGNLKEILISSLYVCFKTTDEIDDGFLMYYFNTSQFREAVENNVEGGIRNYLFYENFSRIKIVFPSLPEQKIIASTILSINNLIDDCTKKLSLLEEHKKGLMQQLFPKQ